MKTLDEIAIGFGTDKASQHPVGAHDYARHYDHWFSPRRDKPIKLLEIGVGGGESIRTWLAYFPLAHVFGVDTVRDTNPWNTVAPAAELPRYTFECGDQGNLEFWAHFIVKYGDDFDIVIDDGGHYSHLIIRSWVALWPVVKPGGYYCIEDLGVAYGPGSVFLTPDWPTHQEFLRARMGDLHTGGDIEAMHLSRELAIIRKK
jgi:SAM-dependent methyltransferase